MIVCFVLDVFVFVPGGGTNRRGGSVGFPLKEAAANNFVGAVETGTLGKSPRYGLNIGFGRFDR